MTTVDISHFDYAIFNIGYGNRFIDAFKKGDFNHSNITIKMIAIHSISYDDMTLKKRVQNKIYHKNLFQTIQSVTNESTYSESNGILTFALIDNQQNHIPIDWSHITYLVQFFSELELCACLSMGTIYKAKYHENNGIRVIEFVFDTESG
jgi:hypothetical protein